MFFACDTLPPFVIITVGKANDYRLDGRGAEFESY
jgi:hypothetical protein